MEGPGGSLAGPGGTFAEYVVDGRNIFLPVLAAFADWCEFFLEYAEEQLLDRSVAYAAACVVVLEHLEVLILGQVLGEVLVAAERVQVDEGAVAFEVSRRVDCEVLGVGVHRVDLLLDFLGSVGEVYAVAQTLAHLGLAVGSGEAETGSVGGQENLGLYECLAVDIVEPVHDFTRELDHRRLILAGGHGRGLEGGDVRCLADGVAEETYGNALLEVAHLDFGLHRRVALYAAYCHQVHIIGGEFAEFGHLALDEDCGLGGVDAYGEVVQSHFDNVLAHLLGVIGIVGKGLRVGNHHVDFVVLAGVLKFDAAAQRAYVVAHMQAPCGAVAG